MKQNNYKIAIIGLGYVGLPLAIEFGKKFKVLGSEIPQILHPLIMSLNDQLIF